jgi:hypothetical protein
MSRLSYNMFIDKLHQVKIVASDLYAVVPSGSMSRTFGASMLSFSIWPFYVTLLIMVLIAKKVVL